MLETERLLLRELRNSDYPNLHALWNNPKVQPTFWGEYVVPLGPDFEDTLKEWYKNNLFQVTIVSKDSEEFMGYSFLTMKNKKNRDAFIAIALLPEFWGKGYAKESMLAVIDYAFHSLGVHRVSLAVFESNTVAIALYKSIGFVQEAVRRKVNWLDGRWQDEILMGILDEEWSVLKQSRTVK